MSTARVFTAEELLHAVSDRSVNKVEIEFADCEQIRELQRRINEELGACGCSEGALGLLGGIGAALTVWLIQWPRTLHGGLASAAVAAMGFTGAALGKFVGHERGRMRGRQIAREYAQGVSDRKHILTRDGAREALQ